VSGRTREWLRGFLRLGARAQKDGITWPEIERQEDCHPSARYARRSSWGTSGRRSGHGQDL